MKYSHIINFVNTTPWAILESKLQAIRGFMHEKAQGIQISDEEIAARIGAKSRPSAENRGGVAVLTMFGVMAQRLDSVSEISGGFSVENFAKIFKSAVNDPNIKAIVLNIDSPGGSVFGIPELAEQIFAARSQKHIVAVANSLAASAAYWLASAADEIVVTPSGMVGSIGVYMIHDDYSAAYEMAGIKSTFIQAGKFKTEGNSLSPLSDEAMAALQKEVDSYYDMFINSVAKGRGVSLSAVRNGYGEGRVLNAKDAKAEGMVDRIDTLDGVLARLGVGNNTARTNMAMAAKKAATA